MTYRSDQDDPYTLMHEDCNHEAGECEHGDPDYGPDEALADGWEDSRE